MSLPRNGLGVREETLTAVGYWVKDRVAHALLGDGRKLVIRLPEGCHDEAVPDDTPSQPRPPRRSGQGRPKGAKNRTRYDWLRLLEAAERADSPNAELRRLGTTRDLLGKGIRTHLPEHLERFKALRRGRVEPHPDLVDKILRKVESGSTFKDASISEGLTQPDVVRLRSWLGRTNHELGTRYAKATARRREAIYRHQ